MTRLQADINKLVSDYPSLDKVELYQRIDRLERMCRFYTDKAPVAPESQGIMFVSFAAALKYAVQMLRKYDKLTKDLAEIADD